MTKVADRFGSVGALGAISPSTAMAGYGRQGWRGDSMELVH